MSEPVVTETAPVTPVETTPVVGETVPTPAPISGNEVGTEAKPEVSTNPSETPNTSEEPTYSRYEKSLERLMATARDTRRKQQEEQQQRQALEFSQKIQQAAQYGPDAVMKALGIEQQKMDLSAILGEEDDGEAPSVKELKKKVAELEGFIKQEQLTAQERQQHERQAQMQAWEQNELQKIEGFLGGNKEKYEYTSTLAPVGSTRDLYNGTIGMYQQGYTPSYDDMAELVENRIEDILDRLAPTKKFQAWAASRLKAQSATPKAQSAPTLKGTLNADSVASVPPENETDEENRQRALKAAFAAREAALKQLKAIEGQ